jgi:hypothetical protein
MKNHVSAPADEAPDLGRVIETFSAANSREASPLEGQLLAALVEEVDPAARAAGETGALWVAAAIVEAVEAGSRYVAPRRIREICRRWAGQAVPGRRAAVDGRRVGAAVRAGASAVRTPRSSPVPARGRSLVDAPSQAPPADDGDAPDGEPSVELEHDRPAERLEIPTFLVDQAVGLTNRQLWAAVLDELRRAVSPGAFATWLKPTRLIGLLDPDGDLVVGVPNSFAREWLGERFIASAEAAVEVVLGQRRRVRFEVEREWLAGAAGRR